MKKLVVLILALAMVVSLAVGCATTATPTTAPTTGATPTLGPPTEVIYVYPALGGTPTDLELVQTEINKITLAKSNVTVKMTPISVANYITQIMTMMAGQEPMDLVETLPGGPLLFTNMVSAGQLMDITMLTPTYGAAILSAMDAVSPDLIKGTTVAGKIYGFTALFDKVSNEYIDIRTDILTKYSIDPAKIKTLADFEAAMATIKAGETTPILAPSSEGAILINSVSNIALSGDLIANSKVLDLLGSATFNMGVVVGTDSTTVENYFATDYYKAAIEKTHEWYQKGYIYKDAATYKDMGGALLASDGAFADFSAGETGHQAQISNQATHAMTSILISNGQVTTGMVQKFAWALPVYTKKPEAALKFLSLTYSDSDVLNLINWGIPDKHYVTNADGTISLPAGVTQANNPYAVNSSFLFGNQYLAKVMAPDPANLREIALASNKSAPVSQMMGLTIDTTSFTDALSAVTVILQQYRPGLESGTSDPAVVLPQFLQALKDAGMDTIIAEAQKQVNAFKGIS